MQNLDVADVFEWFGTFANYSFYTIKGGQAHTQFHRFGRQNVFGLVKRLSSRFCNCRR